MSNILDDLKNLQKQAEVEWSGIPVGVVRRAVLEIEQLRRELAHSKDLIAGYKNLLPR